MNTMEWYYGSDIEDTAVPKEDEMFDRFPMPDRWSDPWGKFGNFISSKKPNAFGVEEILFSEDTFASEVGRPCTPTVSQRSRRAHLQENSDFQLNDLCVMDEADDIFLRSLFEGDAKDGVDRTTKFASTLSKDDVMSDVDHSGERNYIQNCMNVSEDLGPSLPAKNAEHDPSVSEEHSDVYEDMIDDDVTNEESVLTELQSLTVQLGKKTRICFRDSLYRLAQNSRDQVESSQKGKDGLEQCKPTTSGVQSRSRESKGRSETNAIDRTIATLLFNTMNEMPEGEYAGCDSSIYQQTPGGDAEVPKFANMKRSYSVLN